jgi:hypothetical protein
MPLQVAILAALLIGEPFTRPKRIGFALILAGVLGIIWGAGGTIGSKQNLGHALFLAAGLLWACYTVAMKKARLDGLHAAALAAVGALMTYVPAYVVAADAALSIAPWQDIAIQAVVQGLLTRRRLVAALWPGGKHPRCIERSRVRSTVPGDGCALCDTGTRGMANHCRLDRDPSDLGRCLLREWWPRVELLELIRSIICHSANGSLMGQIILYLQIVDYIDA